MFDLPKERFCAYASAFDSGDERMRLKVDHMLRVSEISLRLAEGLALGGRMVRLAYVCGLYHDVGRFRQIERYGTFSDAASADHAELGCEVIAEEGLLDFLPSSEREMVVTAIRNHNKYAIADGVDDPDTLALCELIRDADKADIFRVFSEESVEAITGQPAGRLSEDALSDDVYDCLMGRRCVRNDMRKTALDKLASSLGFLYDINFGLTASIVREQGFYRMRIAEIARRNGPERRRLERLLSQADAYLAERAVEPAG